MSKGYEFLPDHEAVARMRPDIFKSYLRPDQALEQIVALPGLVPVAIDPRGAGRIAWVDLGEQPFREWQFLYTLAKVLEQGRPVAFATDLDILDNDAVAPLPLPVRGLIFHMSRCGSTLLAKCLAACDDHVIINQGGPLQRGFWAWASQDFSRPLKASERHIAMFQRLIAAMARPRRRQWRQTFVKFISWNILHIDFIRAAFPEPPAIFLYRDPVEIIASVVKETSAILLAKGSTQAAFLTGLPAERTAAMDDLAYLTTCYARYFQTALARDDLALLNYRDLQPEQLARVLGAGLGLAPTGSELAAMQKPFEVYSKDDSASTAFEADQQRKQASVAAEQRAMIERELKLLYRQADQAPSNLFA